MERWRRSRRELCKSRSRGQKKWFEQFFTFSLTIFRAYALPFCGNIEETFMNYINIENKSELRSYLRRFEDKGLHIIALDIEAESNLHAYGEKLCLTQIFDGVNNIIIDPLKVDTDTLKLLFENTDILKVMYDAGSDLSLLKNSSNIEIKSILDLRPAVELLDYDKKDLHSVIALNLEYFWKRKRNIRNIIGQTDR